MPTETEFVIEKMQDAIRSRGERKAFEMFLTALRLEECTETFLELSDVRDRIEWKS